MKTTMFRFLVILISGISVFSCGDPSYVPVVKGPVEFHITDAPSDDDNIQGVFVTITDIKADGQSINGFVKQTIDLKALQEGNTKLLLSSILIAKDYSTLTLVVDAETDATGASPGSYVLGSGNTKYKLRSGQLEINVSKTWTVSPNVKSAVIIDFDLRKSIKSLDDPSVKYSFVSDVNVTAAVRVLNHSNTGTINGSYVDQSTVNSDKVIVYAYKKGTYQAVTETQAQGDDKIYFKNAITSAVVKDNGLTRNYTLSFLEAGDYELHFASYKRDTGTDRYSLQTMLAAQSSVNGTVSDIITIRAGVSISVSSLITGSM